jgi:hypothetical protein
MKRHILISIVITMTTLSFGQTDKLNALFAAPNCIKFANSFIGKDESKIIVDYGKDYISQQTTDGLSISYQNKMIKGINPLMMTFIFTSNSNKCTGVAMYFNYMQLDDVIKFMDNNFEPKEPPSDVKVSFFKAWMQNQNGNTYVWKLTKTDKLFFLTIKSLKR